MSSVRLQKKGVTDGFFVPGRRAAAADDLEPSHPRYAPKLAAALYAWMAVTDAAGRSPQQALAKWLCENGARSELTDDEGKPNEQGIEESAKVANRAPGGGASKTPG